MYTKLNSEFWKQPQLFFTFCPFNFPIKHSLEWLTKLTGEWVHFTRWVRPPFPGLPVDNIIFIIGMQSRNVILSISFMSSASYQESQNDNATLVSELLHQMLLIKQNKQNEIVSVLRVHEWCVLPNPRPLAVAPWSLCVAPHTTQDKSSKCCIQNMLSFQL